MSYNLSEHLDAYRRIVETGREQWNDLFEPEAWTYDRFQNRDFLESVLRQLQPPDGARVFEYGCGTGPAACFLAARGYLVDAVDLVPDAITIARRMAAGRDVEVNFQVADICRSELPDVAAYDLVLDSDCLQTVVTDEDRDALFAAVHARLKPSGHYVISTALYQPTRDAEQGYRYDADTGIYYRQVADDDSTEVVIIDGHRYLPHRRHRTADDLGAELVAQGFRVLGSISSDGNVVCSAER